MSYQKAEEANCQTHGGSVDLVIEPKQADLGEFSVRRALPSKERRRVGPFVFFDHMGPAEFPPGRGIAVRPHPHIGIATITYLFEGEIMHRDSLGVTQPIRPGAVNLMTAGRGIVHSERAGDDLEEVSRLHGIQSWIALPEQYEECEPDFAHYPAAELPAFDRGGVGVTLIMGEAFGHRSPVQSYSRTLYMDCRLEPGTGLSLPEGEQELAAYVVEGAVDIEGEPYAAGVMAVASPGAVMELHARSSSRVIVIGGDALAERHMYWNFVHSSRHRIEQARADWREGRFPPVPGDDEFIPLPD